MRHLGLGTTISCGCSGLAVGGIMLGAWLSGTLAGRRSARELVRMAYVMMALAAAANLLVRLRLPPAVPWSVLPLGLYTTGMSLAAPSITLFILDLFPELRGTVSSLQGFVQTLFASVVAGVIAPLLGMRPCTWRWAWRVSWRWATASSCACATACARAGPRAGSVRVVRDGNVHQPGRQHADEVGRVQPDQIALLAAVDVDARQVGNAGFHVHRHGVTGAERAGATGPW